MQQDLAPLAISYVRFSTPEQLRGDSLRRQTAKAERYARDHGLRLDTTLTFRDLGISAFRGANAETGRLGDFLRAVESGLVPAGSFLLVENLDRISRLTARRALRVLESIVDRGIALVTLDDGRVYTAESLDKDPMSFMLAVLTFIRGNEESARKAERLRSSWVGKRDKATEHILTRRAPAWLRVANRRFVVIEERAEVVRRIFELVAAGRGLEGIARSLNTESIPTFGRAKFWHRSYILKIIESPAPSGSFVPHTVDHLDDPVFLGRKKRVRRPLDPIPGYFPAIVDQALSRQVQAMRNRRAPATRTLVIRNVLGGLASCAKCGSTLTRVVKGKRSRPYLVCSKAKAGAGCEYQAFQYDPVELTLRGFIQSDGGRTLMGFIVWSAGNLMQQLGDVESELNRTDEQLEEAMELALSSPTPSIALRKKLNQLEQRKSELTETLEVMPDPRATKAAIERLASLKEWDPNQVNALLRQALGRVVVEADKLTLCSKGERAQHHVISIVQ